MGFKLVEVVYRLDKNATTASEQAVLLALAFRANDKTLLCYPKQDTLAEMTHLHRATVSQCLNTLREKGLIDWKSGGLRNRRGKQGRPLANDYRLNLTAGGKKGVAEGAHSVAQDDTAVLPTATPTEKQQPLQKEDTSPIPNRSVSDSVSDFDKALRSMGIEGVGSRMKEQARHEASPVVMALNACRVTPGTPEYRDNCRTFSSVMIKIGQERAMEVVRTFASELRQGEMENVRNLAALLMSRLQQCLP